MKKFFLLIMLSIIFPVSIEAADVEYTLFDSVITVNQNRTLDVEEKYRLYFIEDTETISRKLNSRLVEIRPNQSNLMIESKISRINSDFSFQVENKNQLTTIQIKTDGKQDDIDEYNASYQFNLGKDSSKNYDELYYDIVSNVDAAISNLTFTINMPSGYDASKVHFAIDGKYNLTEDDLEVDYQENQISGTLNKLLEENQKFSVYIELPNGYFVGTSDNFNYFNYLILVFPIISFIIILVYWIRFGKNNSIKLKSLHEFNPRFTPAEIGYLYKGKCEEMDLISNLLHLATQGYLKVVENDDGYKLSKENSFKFIKLKDYDKNNAAEKLLFDHLFRDSDVAELESIEYHFFDKLMDAKYMLENNDNHKKLFFSNVNQKKIISLILIAISVVAMNFNSIYLFTNNYFLVPIFIALNLLGLYCLFFSNTTIILKIIFGFGLLSGLFYIGINSFLLQPKMLVIYIFGMILIYLCCLVYRKLSVRTKYGNEVLSEAISLKKYIETMPLKEFIENQNKNSSFYFEVIPYACVLDSLRIWINKGKDTIKNPPSWYVPSEEFTIRKFEKFIQNFLYTTTMVMLKKAYTELGTEYSSDKAKTNLNN